MADLEKVSLLRKDSSSSDDFSEEPERIGSLKGRSSSLRSAYNVICTVVGAGLLQLPNGLSQSGWSGVILLVVMGIMSCYTAVILIKTLLVSKAEDPTHLPTYGDIGETAFGKVGRWVVNVQMHVTLMGVATVYLVLSGSNICQLMYEHNLFGEYMGNPDFWNPDHKLPIAIAVVIVAAIVWWHVWLKTLHEVGVVSAFNVGVAVALAIFVIVEIFVNPGERPSDAGHTFLHYQGCSDLTKCSLGAAFASFSFSFGAHPVLPTIYESMAKPKQYNMMILLTFIAILAFYLPISIIGYWAYGDQTLSPIYNNLCAGNSCPTQERVGKIVAIIAITLHVMFSYAVVINPSELAAERVLKIDERSAAKAKSVLLRTVLVIITALLAIAIPNFGLFLNLVSSFTSSFTAFILPSVFYLKIFWDDFQRMPGWRRAAIISWNTLIIVCALLGCFFGSLNSITGILRTVFKLDV